MKRISGILPILVILGIVIIFFARLFFPEPKLFYTSETLGSDLWSNYYPQKHFLGESLKRGEFPFWSKDIGTGFPLFAEGQIGTLYLPNLVLYYLLPTWLAWNLNYAIVFFLAFLGSFLFFKRIGISRWSSLFSAFSFSFGGYLISRVIHTSPLQTISLMPWLFLTGDYLWQKQSIRNAGLFAFVLSQQIFAGGINWVFISLLGFFLYSIVQFRERESRELIKKIGLLALAIFFAFAIAAPQIMPTLELRGLSARGGGLTQEEIFIFPYSIKNLINFVLPNYFGTPKDASFAFEPDLGLYWENTAYIGILPIIFLFITLARRRKRRWEWSFLILGAFSLLLVFGRSSPIYFLLTLPGFNNFRVPSSFLVLATFSVAALAGVGLDWVIARIPIKKVVAVGIIVPSLVFLIAVADLYRFGTSYHSYVSVREALAPPETIEGISPGERIYTNHEQFLEWKKAYFRGGWQDTEAFVYLKNGLYADMNLVFGLAHLRAYAGLYPSRFERAYELAPQLLDASNVKHIVSPIAQEDEGLELAYTVDPPREDLPTYYVYENIDRLDRFRFVSSHIIKSDIDGIEKVIKTGDFPFNESVILEEEPGETFEPFSEAEVVVEEESNQRLELRTKTDQKAILVVADSFYPAWQATINGEGAEILPANINQRAVIVPAGENTILFTYYPKQFIKGLKVSGASLTVFVILAVLRPERRFRKPKD